MVLNDNVRVTPVLLAGGMGTRLKPLTGMNSPKPFLKLLSAKSLFQETVLRSLAFGAPVIVCHENYLSFVKEQLKAIHVKPRVIILEPEHKGTAAAIALAAFYLKNKGETMLVLPTDHYVEDAENFEDCVDHGIPHAQNAIVALGAVPTRPESGYGYVEYVPHSEQEGVFKVRNFVEKPDVKKARAFIKQGTYLWYTGMFLSRPKTFLDLVKTHTPDLYKTAERSFYAGNEASSVYTVNTEDFSKIDAVSVDIAIMEKLKNAYVCVLETFWGDVGTWPQILRQKVRLVLKRA